MSKKFLALGSPARHAQAPSLYVQKVREINLALRKEMIHKVKRLNLLEQCVPFFDEGTMLQLFTTGSDGREEKFGRHVPTIGESSSTEVSTSPMEIGLLIKGNRQAQDVGDIVEATLVRSGLFGESEIKYIESDTISYFRDRPDAVWPTRLVDAKALSTTFTISGGKLRKGEEVKPLIEQGQEVLGKKLAYEKDHRTVQKVKEQVKYYQKIIQRGGLGTFRKQDVRHFSLEDGLLAYNPALEERLGSVKYGPLRYVQLFLAHRLLRSVMEQEVPIDIFSEIRPFTREKIYTLVFREVLDMHESEAKSLADVYEYFLWCYFLSVFHYIVDGQYEVEVPDRAQFREAMHDVLLLTKG